MYLDFTRRTQRYVPRHLPRSREIPRFATRVYHFTLSGVSHIKAHGLMDDHKLKGILDNEGKSTSHDSSGL